MPRALTPYLPVKPARRVTRLPDHWVGLIAASRFFYALLLIAFGIGAFNLIGKNLSAELLALIRHWHFDSHSYVIRLLLHMISDVSPGKLLLWSVATFFYAGLSMVEGFGLAMDKNWARWLVIYDTASFIPIQIYQLGKEFNWFNLILLLGYAAIAIYLVRQAKQKRVEGLKYSLRENGLTHIKPA